MIIKPTVGRVVWFYPALNSAEQGFCRVSDGEPLAAIIARVWNDRLVNLTVFDANGVPHSRTSVQLVQDGDLANPNGYYAQWMPYQQGQAQKTAIAEAALQIAATTATADLTDARDIDIARVCHEVNRAYCTALGDFSQPAWEDAPLWQKDSALLGVKLHTSNPDASAAASHESWMAQKLAEGWGYGPVKDPTNKTHPCILPFNQLPVAQQAKDFIFRGVVHALTSLDKV